TERRRYEEALIFNNVILRTQQELSTDGILVVGAEGTILSFNQRFVDLWGIPRDVIESKSDARALGAVMDRLASPDEFIRKVKRLYEAHGEISSDLIALKDGRLYDRYSAPMNGADGRYYGRVWYFRDVTEQKRSQEVLEMTLTQTQDEKAKTEAILAAIGEAISIQDRQFNILFQNEIHEKLMGRHLGELCYRAYEGKDRICDDCPVVRAFEDNAVHRCERAVGANRKIRYFDVVASPLRNAQGVVFAGVEIVRDITERNKVERRRIFLARILSTLNEPLLLTDAIQRISVAIKGEMGFDAVGLRLRDGADYPYCFQDGFSDDFVVAENTLAVCGCDKSLCADKDGNPGLECTCGLVIMGKTDPSNPLFTPGGSFWTNDALPLLELTADQDPRFHPRNRCIHEGFRSVALIPIRADNRIVGLLQLNDRQKDCFTIELIQFFEQVCSAIGLLLVRKQAEQALAENEKRFMDVLYASNDPILLIDGDKFVDGNDAAMRMLGYACRNDFLMIHPSKLSPPVQPDGQSSLEKADRMMRIACEKGFHRFEWTHRKAGGEDFLVEVSLTSVVIGGKGLLHCVWRDIAGSEREREEKNKYMRELEIFYKASTGREERILELKREIERLKRESKKP
ncbi:MAG: PAS domain-containing protein, partial [Candidatus Omnitrophota bacterium]